MKSIKIVGLFAVALVVAIIAFAFKKDDAGKGFAVIELFTSEGCSSCPPADNLVAKIEKESKDQPIYILAYHVDYWDRLGWKDTFSNPDYSKRQRDYASHLKLQSVYTPQIIINGATEMIGSEEGAVRNAIKTSLQTPATAQLTLNVLRVDDRQVDIKYNASGTDKNTVLLVAALQKNAQTRVAKGENGGRTLSHVQIVRKLQQFNVTGNNGTVKVTLPKGLDFENGEMIGFLQNISTGKIAGAAKVMDARNTAASIVNK